MNGGPPHTPPPAPPAPGAAPAAPAVTPTPGGPAAAPAPAPAAPRAAPAVIRGSLGTAGTLRASTTEPYVYFRRSLLVVAGIVALASSGTYLYGRYGEQQEIERQMDAIRAETFKKLHEKEKKEAPAPTIRVKGTAKRLGDAISIESISIQPETTEFKLDQCAETHPGEFRVTDVRAGGNGVLLAKVEIAVKAHHTAYRYRVRGFVQANDKGLAFAQQADLVPDSDVPGIK